MGITIYTDEYPIYNGLKKLLKVKAHKTVIHSQHIYANDRIHPNNCENRHSLLKPFLNMYRGVSKKNLNNYVKFFQFIHNNGLNWVTKALKTILTTNTQKRT
jgi:transposase-like protein